jgi:hypothetical protein
MNRPIFALLPRDGVAQKAEDTVEQSPSAAGAWTYTYESKGMTLSDSQFSIDRRPVDDHWKDYARETTTTEVRTGINMTYGGRTVWAPLFSFTSDQTTVVGARDIKAAQDAAQAKQTAKEQALIDALMSIGEVESKE